jgi:DNA mismatch repair protein MutS
MLAHYLEVKAAHPDCLVFYRMGDFYELFFEDAVEAAGALDITLTKRGKQAGQDVPMCGVPVHAAESYLARLIKAGFRVAVCEQVEDPAEAKKRGGAKALVRREVVRVVTPGTLTEDTLLDARRHNYLAAVAEAAGETGVAWLDMTTGDFFAEAVGRDGLGAALARLEPEEILLADRLAETPDLFELWADWRDALTVQPAARFDSENAGRRLMDHYGVRALDAFGPLGRAEVAAAGALLDYVELTQVGRAPRLGRLSRAGQGGILEIDAATRRSLELTRTLSGDRKGTLLAVIDRTVTGPGARLLAARLASPLTDPLEINARLDMVQFFADGADARERVRDLLKGAPDMERAVSRLMVGRGGPRDLAAVRDGLSLAPALRDALGGEALAGPPDGIADCTRGLGEHGPLVDRLGRALADDLPMLARDGGFIADDYSGDLAEQRRLSTEGRKVIAEMEARYRGETGIASLKIRHNNVIGYFIEVTAAQRDKMPDDPESPFIHRQTMASGTRYTTVELSELETRISRAAEKALALELALFDDLVAEVAARVEPIAEAARALAGLDVAAALAELAIRRNYCRPQVDASLAFEISGGRHPVVEAAFEDPFVANDCDLNPGQRLWLVTGPNMAGKSTFLRQNALIAILAQMGSYVPAAAAHIGAVDRLFSRVGAADDLARGRSTFMVEMVETAAILNRATGRSLVILDEIGRGTATFDGLSIAWATVEHLHETNRCRALFATHYHELTALAARLDALACHTMRVKEWEGEVVFLHEVAQGNADRSYGIHVAKLAGLPPAVVARAGEVLKKLEEGEQSGNLKSLADDLPLFSAAVAQAEPEAPAVSAVEEMLAGVNPDELSPREALELLYRLRKELP